MGKGPNTLEELIKSLSDAFADVDMIAHAGDITSQSVLDELKRFAPVEAVQGNMDRGRLPSLPEKRVLALEGKRIGLIHGWGAPKGIRQRIKGSFQDVDVIIYGHTHEPFNGEIEGVLFFNPGSPTDSFHAPYKSVGILAVSDVIKGEIIKL